MKKKKKSWAVHGIHAVYVRCWRHSKVGLPVERSTMRWLNPFRTAVPFWGQTSQIPCSLSPKRDCGSKGVNGILAVLAADAHILPSANISGAQFSVLTIIVFVHIIGTLCRGQCRQRVPHGERTARIQRIHFKPHE